MTTTIVLERASVGIAISKLAFSRGPRGTSLGVARLAKEGLSGSALEMRNLGADYLRTNDATPRHAIADGTRVNCQLSILSTKHRFVNSTKICGGSLVNGNNRDTNRRMRPRQQRPSPETLSETMPAGAGPKLRCQPGL